MQHQQAAIEREHHKREKENHIYMHIYHAVCMLASLTLFLLPNAFAALPPTNLLLLHLAIIAAGVLLALLTAAAAAGSLSCADGATWVQAVLVREHRLPHLLIYQLLLPATQALPTSSSRHGFGSVFPTCV